MCSTPLVYVQQWLDRSLAEQDTADFDFLRIYLHVGSYHAGNIKEYRVPSRYIFLPLISGLGSCLSIFTKYNVSSSGTAGIGGIMTSWMGIKAIGKVVNLFCRRKDCSDTKAVDLRFCLSCFDLTSLLVSPNSFLGFISRFVPRPKNCIRPVWQKLRRHNRPYYKAAAYRKMEKRKCQRNSSSMSSFLRFHILHTEKQAECDRE